MNIRITTPIIALSAALAAGCSPTLADPVEPLVGEVPAAYTTSPQPEAEYVDPANFQMPDEAQAAILITRVDEIPCDEATAAYFPTDAAALDDHDRVRLTRFANCLVENASGDVELQLVGRADARGTDDYNLELGMNRAVAVKEYFLSLGFEESQIGLATAGERASSDDGRTDWDTDRRVEVMYVEDDS